MVDMSTENTFLVRVRMTDRPGALGAVAGRIGAVRGDLIGIEILERRDGFVVDELQVSLPAFDLSDLLVRELSDADDVIVEDIRAMRELHHDPQLAAFEVADILIGADSTDELMWSLCVHARRAVRTDWVAVMDEHGVVEAGSGAVPDAADLARLIDRAKADAVTPSTPPPHGIQLLWMPLPTSGLALVAGRDDLPFRSRERQMTAAMARVAGSWHGRLRERSRLRGMLAHPSAGADDATVRQASYLGR